MVAVCSSDQDALIDMQHGLDDFDDWHLIKVSNFQMTFQGHHAYVSNRLDERSTMVSFLFCYLSYLESYRQTGLAQ